MINFLVALGFSFSILTAVIPPIDTRVGTDASDSPTASIFGAAGEVYGNCFPSVSEPNGMTSWTPQTRITEKKGVAPYYYGDRDFLGFRSSHWMMGSATQDYGSFYIMPDCKPVPLNHEDEEATPSYYRLGRYELAAKSRSAIFRMACDSLLFGVNNGYGEGSICLDETSGLLTAENPVHRIYQGWGEPAGFSGWSAVRFNRRIESFRQVDERTVSIVFESSDNPLIVKMSTSFTSSGAAVKNMDAEIPHWDFDSTRAELAVIWKEHLGQIEVSGGSAEITEHFYTSLWRASVMPRTVSDFGEETDYDDFSLWDTFRAVHPLITILDPDRTSQMIRALLRKYDRGGWLPIFPCWGSYTSAMIGDHAISVIADAYTKGIRDFDVAKAYRAIRQNAFETPDSELYKDGRGRRALGTYMRLGYLPLEEPVQYAFHGKEQTSRTLEYAYDDWCASLLAWDYGNIKDYNALKARSRNWKNIFDPVTLYPQGRHEDGTFLKENNYLTKTSFITEGTPCHYAWFVPHDVKGLVKMLGKEEFEARLDSMFTESRYWHGNEPCHHVAYLYDWVGRPDKTAKVVSDIIRTEYRNTPGGLSGNDDCGQMSAWYVFSCLGFYPVCPGSAEYALGAPAFDTIIIHQKNGSDFTIERNADRSGTSFRLNGKRHPSPFLKHGDIVEGGTLLFE